MRTHDGFSTGGPSAITVPPRSRGSLEFGYSAARARECFGFAVLLMLGFFGACDWHSDITAIDSLKETVTLTLQTPEARVYEGQTRQMELTVSQGGTVVNPGAAGLTISWRSEDPSIASVDGKGLLEGIAEGETQIVASTEGREVSAIVAVVPGQVPICV